MKSIKKRFIASVLSFAMLASAGFAYALEAEPAETVITKGAEGENDAAGEDKTAEEFENTLNQDENIQKDNLSEEAENGESVAEEKTEDLSSGLKEQAQTEQTEPALYALSEYSGATPEYLDLSLTKTQYIPGDKSKISVCSGTEKIPSDDMHLSYTSSNPEFFKVDEQGNIEAVAIGNSVITVTFTADDGEVIKNKMAVFCTKETVNINRAEYVQILDQYKTQFDEIPPANDPVGIGSDGVYKAKGSYYLLSHTVAKSLIQMWFYDDGVTDGNIMTFFVGRIPVTMAQKFLDIKRTGGAGGYYYADIASAVESGDFYADNLIGDCRTKERKKGWHQLSVVNITVDENSKLHRILFDGEPVAEYESRTDNGKSYLIPQMVCFPDSSMYVKGGYYVSNMSEPEPGIITSTSFIYGKPENNLVDAPLDITFSKNIDKNHVDKSWVALTERDNENVIIECDVSAEENVLRVMPKYPLKNDTYYRLTVKTGVRFEDPVNKPGYFASESRRIFPTCKAKLYAKDWRDVSGADFFGAEATLVNNSKSNRTVYVVMNVSEGEKIVETAAKKYVLAANSGETQGCGISSKTGDITGKSAEFYIWEKIGEDIGNPICESFSLKAAARSEKAAETADSSYVSIDMNQDTGKVSINGYSLVNRLDMPVIIAITKPSAGNSMTACDYKTATEENFSDVYYMAGQGKTKADGTFGYEMPISGRSGVYNVIVRLPFENTVYEKNISFISDEEKNDILSDINTATETNAAERINNAITKLGIKDSSFDNVENKDYIYNYILKKNDYSSAVEFKEHYFRALENIISLEKSDESTLEYLGENAAALGISGHTGYLYMLKTKQTVLKEMLKKIRKCKNDEEIKKIIEDNMAVVSLRYISNYSEIYDIVKTLNEYIGAKLTVYEELSSEGRAAVQKAFEGNIGENTTNADVKKLFDDAAANASKSDDPVPAPSPGKGGGGGGGGSSSGANKKTISAAIDQDNSEDSQYSLPQWVLDEQALLNRVSFSDLDEAEWAKESINNLYNQNIINGYEDGRFGVNDNITREQLVKILVLAGKLEMPQDAEIRSFSDVNGNEWYSEYINIAVANGIVNGQDNARFGVGQLVTREDAAAMIYRLSQAKNVFLDEDITIFPFKDTDEISEYAKHAVEVLRESLIINGVAGNNFAPKRNLTRAEAAKIVFGYMNYIK